MTAATSSSNRFFVSDEVNCIVVRDRHLSVPRYRNADIVWRWWSTEHHHVCLTCGTKQHSTWSVSPADRRAANKLAAGLNAAEANSRSADIDYANYVQSNS